MVVVRIGQRRRVEPTQTAPVDTRCLGGAVRTHVEEGEGSARRGGLAPVRRQRLRERPHDALAVGATGMSAPAVVGGESK